VTGTDHAPRVDDVDSIVKPVIGRKIDEILDIATKDPTEAIKSARRWREWLKRKIDNRQSHQDIPEVIKELSDLIGILRKG